MTKKVIMGFTLMLILLVPAMSMHASAQTSQSYTITGAGSTFVFPLMDNWRVEYNKIHPEITLNYQSIGSGAGIKLLEQKSVDFGASDAPLSATDMKNAPGVLTIPESIGGITIAYNLPGIDKGLKLTGPVIAQIFMGNITSWNDPAIVNLNPGTSLPNQKIVVAHRSDGSGTTYAFTDYLSKISPDWKTKVGQGKSVPWPVGTGGQGNAGVANIVKTTQYAVGYVELAYVFQNKMTYAFVQNADGNAFVEPTLDSVAADAAAAGTNLPSADGDWSQVSIVSQPGSNSYPISTLTYVMIYKDLSTVNGETQDKSTQVLDFLNWIIGDGQQYASGLLYVPLPDSIKKIDEAGLAEVSFSGGAVPEFGPVAALVLAIAIVSIIAVSSKSRIGFNPKI
ncbi:MAG: phosphate ABC transporter substrate-binding protein PstS [Thaumarchaeota archaeon]|nr:phosphate ABC transporter substrate-binding protein PstS [Nitrososphaerota archaeon]MDE1817095.1 phosphate ABC transporter substrate-binding protein PstS [Nitrososphaerota archaeon]MDE1876165.1 phosphate ABC transporter substrate-binding protein PstS [Nitrososphaerota archaeon]